MAEKALLGILGGTFDPVHYGHLLAAEWACEVFRLDQLVFMPSARPPHKDLAGVLDSQHRIRMVELAVQDNPDFSVSSLELERTGLSYTVDTLQYYLDEYPGIELYFIIGVDALQLLYTWKDVERLVELCTFIVVTRPGYILDRSDPAFQSVPDKLWKRLRLLSIPGLEISSSEIRKRIMQGLSIRYLLPPAVEAYIKENHLYQDLQGE
jgi:nicotinate-nucleotide adenylyltransferase